MLRVLMVLEDYGELMFLQTVLKKMGFDVDAIQNPRSVGDSVLKMNPEILLMTAHGRKVRGLELARSTRRLRGLPHVLLLGTPGPLEDQDPEVQGWLLSPVKPMELLNKISELCKLNPSQLREKFLKLQAQEPELQERELLLRDQNEPTLDRSKGDNHPAVLSPEAPSAPVLQPSTLAPLDRKARYDKFLEEELPGKVEFEIKTVQEKVRELRLQEKPEDTADLERERKAFVAHLFRSKKNP